MSRYYRGILEKLRHKTFAQDSNCYKTAAAIMTEFTGKNDKPIEKVFLDEEHFNGLSDTLLEESKLRSSTVFHRLYEESKEIEHMVFHINIGPEMHGLVIEKEGDGKTTIWRIYQSWKNVFTLSQWLNVEPWPSKQQQIDNIKLTQPDLVNYVACMHDFNDKYCANFGRGNALTSNEIKEFLELILDFCKKLPRMVSYLKCKSEPGYPTLAFTYYKYKLGFIEVHKVKPHELLLAQQLTTFSEIFDNSGNNLPSPHDDETNRDKNLTLNSIISSKRSL